MNNQNYFLSVCMITYKHEEFISQAILGVLNQEVNFDFELLIFDDNSPDNTHKVVQEIISNHPKGSVINYIINVKNLGIVPNFQKALLHCRGKYIALCEGDDYWIDKQKLSKQLLFLENNKEYIACFHNAYIKKENSIIGSYSKRDKPGKISIGSIIEIGGGIFPTASLVFKNPFFFDFPNLESFISGDRMLILNLVNQGEFYYFADFMSVYRIHNLGVYSSIQNNDLKISKVYLSNIYLLNYFQNKYYPNFLSNFKKSKSIQARYFILTSKKTIVSFFKVSRYLIVKDFFKLIKTLIKRIFKKK
jgi:glycosyltransferase involved in cell wall biosynthesis